jgi:ABC-type nitrate/sulfonate/bicarbonate transport system permease component
MSSLKSLLSRSLVAISLILLWQLTVSLAKIEPFIIPPPLLVAKALFLNASLLLHHTLFTLTEIIVGLLIGFTIGTLFGIILASYSHIQRLLLPILVISQAIPVFALAPILVVWLGYGMASKITMAALIIFFPVASATHDGLQAYPHALHNLCNTMSANPLRALIFVKIPACLPSIASGARIATATAPIGAIVGEWVGSAQGLGFIMLHANARMHTDLMFAALFILVLLALALYALVNNLLTKIIFWQTSNPKHKP